MDIGFWTVTVLLTKAVYYYAVRIIHKDYGRQKAIRMTAIVVAVSLIADGAAFFVPNYRMYLLIDTSVQFVLVYIWSVIRICVFSKMETVLRIVAMMFPLLLTGFVEYYRDDNNVLVEGMFVTAGALVSLLMYNYAFCLMPKVQQANELESKRHQIEIIHEQEQQLSVMNTVLDEITNDFKKLKIKKYCANTITNVILNQTARRCKEADIAFDVNAELPQELGINDIHLCSIFNNLCNNAVKANEFVDRDRFITVNCSLKGNYMHVSVENAFDPGHKREKRKGYGMLILKDIADRYDGEYSVMRKKNVFRATFIAKVSTDLVTKEAV